MNTGLFLVLGLAIAVVALVWFFFMAPLERQMHERRLQMIQKKIEKRQQGLGDNGSVKENGDR